MNNFQNDMLLKCIEGYYSSYNLFFKFLKKNNRAI